jgi:hypothetical protein
MSSRAPLVPRPQATLPRAADDDDQLLAHGPVPTEPEVASAF